MQQPTCATHFTGKERDTESGNDYFGARYYTSSVGRFMSPDWSKTPSGVPYAILSNPQSLNLYSYVFNNPLSRTDPDGHCSGGWALVCSWLNVVEVKVTAGIQTGISGQWGVAKAKAQATLIGAEASSGLGGGNAEAKVQTKASASASAGPASAGVSVGGQISTSDGASASASAKVSVGPAQASATASVDSEGGHAGTSVGGDVSKGVDTDSKLGGGFNALVGGEVSIDFSQIGRAWGDTVQAASDLVNYVTNPVTINGQPAPLSNSVNLNPQQ